MADIKVNVLTMGGEQHEIETPPDIMTGDFISELLIALHIPQVDAEGVPINWRIDDKDTGSSLDNAQTLEQNGVKESHTLFLLRATTAGGTDKIQLLSKGKSFRRIAGVSEENIYGLEDGYLLLPQVMLPLLREHIENDPASKWFDRSIGFFLGACLGFSVPAFDDKAAPVFRAALGGAAGVSFIAVIILIILERKAEERKKKVITPLVDRLSSEIRNKD